MSESETVIDMATETLGEVSTPSKEADVTEAVDIDVILAERAAYKAALEAAAEHLRTAQRYGDAKLVVRSHRSRYGRLFPDEDALDAMMRDYDGEKWRHLLHKSGMRSFLDATARAAWQKHLDEGTAPELTKESVQATFALLLEERAVMFERGVVELFRKLDWDYRTNSPRMLGKRIIISHALHFGHVAPEFANRLDDIIRVFSVLDGKPEPDHRQGAYHQLSAKRWPLGENDVVVSGFFSCRGFKNGNCHVTFLRLDLVAKANRIIAKAYPNALPPSDH